MDELKKSQDVWFCSFLVHKGHKIHSYEVISRGKVKCAFEISDEDWKQLRLEFQNSEISRYKTTIEQIKDLAW